jgi:hypothetical protein
MNDRLVRLDDKLSRDEISVGQYDPEYFEQDGTLWVRWQKWFWENSDARAIFISYSYGTCCRTTHAPLNVLGQFYGGGMWHSAKKFRYSLIMGSGLAKI